MSELVGVTQQSGVTGIVADIVALWSDMNPAAGYTGGHLAALDSLFVQTPANREEVRQRIVGLRGRLDEIDGRDLRATAAAILTTLATQLDFARPSGAGPSGTGAGGVFAAADGVFYIVLKGDHNAAFVPTYLKAVEQTVIFETSRWAGQDASILVRQECLNTADYLEGTLASLTQVRPDVQPLVDAILAVLPAYRALFAVDGLDAPDFATRWKVFQQWDAAWGPMVAPGYPRCLRDAYQITDPAREIETTAEAWLDLDMPVTTALAQQVAALPSIGATGTLQDIWDRMSEHYAVDFSVWMDKVVKACNEYGSKYIIRSTSEDRVDFAATPSYLVNLVTGGEDFAVNYLDPAKAYSQLYLTTSKNTSLLTMINILVHEASHGYNFVLSAHEAPSPLLNLNTALEVPMTEGMAFYREFQYWQAAAALLGRTDLDPVEAAYLGLYGENAADQAEGVLCAQLETYIWRVIRYIRALCDVRVNGGAMTYTQFIEWAAKRTGLSVETLHGECFTFMASPGYAPCYAMGGAVYARYQKAALARGMAEIDFNTACSAEGFYAWPVAVRHMASLAQGSGPA